MIHEVDSSAALTKALKSASAGDTILLAGGDYHSVNLKDLTFAENVTIASRDASDRAVFSNVSIKNVTGLTFRDVEFVAKGSAATTAVTVMGSHDIRFDTVFVHGSLDDDASNDASGMMIRTSSNVEVVNSEFQQLYWGVAHLDNTGLTVSGNRFHEIRLDGVRGGGSSDVVVSGNRFWDFQSSNGDHPDAIQFWTTNTTASAHNIVVERNVMERGEGDAFQGILISDRAGFPFEGVTIRGNVIVGGMYNGIQVGGARDLTITDNVVQGFTDMKSWVRVNVVDGLTMSNNSANTFLIGDDVQRVVLNLANEILPLASDGGAATLLAWLLGSIESGGEKLPSGGPGPWDPGFLQGALGDGLLDLSRLSGVADPYF